MKKSEKENLKKAFNIPEPERKESFVSLYNEKLKKNEHKFNMPVFFRYASTFAFAVLSISLWGHFNKTADFKNRFELERPAVTTTQSVTATQLTSKSNITYKYTTEMTTVKTSDIIQNIPQTTHATIDMPDVPEFIPSAPVVTTATTTESTTTKKITFTTKTATYPTTTKRTTTAVTIADQTEVADTPASADYVTVPTVPSPAITTTKSNIYEPFCPTNDYTVFPNRVYHKSECTVNVDEILNATPEISTSTDNVSIDSLKNNSDFVIMGKIDDIIYTDIYGKPFTVENITIINTYKGFTLNPGDRISVYMQGGYMPVEAFNESNNLTIELPDNYSVYDPGGNKGIQNIGETFIFFIKNGDYNMPKNSFRLTEYTDISVFRKQNRMYISLGNGNLKFDIKNLLKF